MGLLEVLEKRVCVVDVFEEIELNFVRVNHALVKLRAGAFQLLLLNLLELLVVVEYQVSLLDVMVSLQLYRLGCFW